MNLFAKTALLRPIEKILIGFHVVDNLSVSADVLIKKIFLKQGLLKSINTMPLFRTLRLASFFPAFQP